MQILTKPFHLDYIINRTADSGQKFIFTKQNKKYAYNKTMYSKTCKQLFLKHYTNNKVIIS